MKRIRVVLPLALLFAAMSWAHAARAQNPTAVQRLQLSAFGGGTGVFTGLQTGKNLGFTAGVDLALMPIHGLIRPTVEIRGTYPVHDGKVDSERDILGGLRLDVLLNYRIHPYGDFLFGRGQMNYSGNGYYYNNFVYDLTTTYVYSPGVGFDFDLGSHFAVKFDGQYQRWGSTPTPSGAVFSKVGTLGVVYHFDFNGRDRP
jgi:hypothetical protein